MGWRGGEGQSFTVTFNAPEDASGLHTGIIKGDFIGCPDDNEEGGGGKDWGVSARATVECPITAVKFPTDGTDVQDMDNVSLPDKTIVKEDLGKRIFAGAKSSGGNANNEVKVVVQFKDGAKIPDRIFLKSFDVDDPSFDSGPVDNEDGSDNRASVLSINSDGEFKNGENKIEESPGEKGKVSVQFKVTLSPGDNFRVCASCSKKVLDDLKAKNPDPDDKAQVFKGDKAVPDDNEGTAQVKSTEVLTTWRKLHIELDAMGKVTGNFSSGDSTKQVIKDNNNNETIVEVDANNLDDGGDKGRFESGILTVNSTEYPIKKNNSDDFVLDGLYNVPVGDPWIAHDDDVYTNDNLPMPDTDGLNLALSDVYMEPMYDVGDDNNTVDIVLNYESNLVIGDDWDSADKNSKKFWVSYVLSGFQAEIDDDGDPDSEYTPEGEKVAAGETGILGGDLLFISKQLKM